MGAVEGEKYCLKWNDFTSNLSSAFNELRDDEDFFDVTLLTEESEIRCHKLILGACSPHFRHIIKRLSTVQNPAIYLRGVRHEDIKNILEFMYLGEVSVAQEDLDSFLSVAQDLCIKGLTQGDQSQPSGNAVAQPSQSSRSSSSSVSQGPPTKRPRVMTKNNGETAKNIPKPEPKMEYKPEPEVIDADMDDPQVLEEYDDYYEDDSTPGPSDSGGDKDCERDQLAYEIHEYMSTMSNRKDEGYYVCIVCGRFARSLWHQREHILTHMVKDQEFKLRLKKFVDLNTIKDSNTKTCLICQTKITVHDRKHFVNKHLRHLEFSTSKNSKFQMSSEIIPNCLTTSEPVSRIRSKQTVYPPVL